ncbi:MAG: CoA-binding protein, partial [Betaproteobacteria bacterium]|nr:CoA-binding protein [Betaproteobacteria bacterium]
MNHVKRIGDLFTPKTIAVVGASADENKFSGRILPYLIRNGFPGELYPINPKRSDIQGKKCYADLMSVPGTIDCVVFSLGAEDLDAVYDSCVAKSVKLLLVTSAGFAERDDDIGHQRQQRLIDFSRRTGIRVLGPNCVGFLNLVDQVAMAAAAVLEFPNPPKGRIGLISQSGGIGMATIPFNAFERGIGFSRIINSGNEADLELAELTHYLVDDPATDVIALVVEGVRNGARLLQVLHLAAQKGKPVLILKTGKSSLGQHMAASHTGAMAGSDEVFDAMCRRTGAMRVDDIEEIYQFGAMFSRLIAQGKLNFDRKVLAPDQGCTAFSVSGGNVGLFGDVGSANGLNFPVFESNTQSQLQQLLNVSTTFNNPVDLTGGSVSDHSIWGKCLTSLLEDYQIQLAVPVLTVARNYDPAINDILRVNSQTKKIVIVLWVGGALSGEGKKLLQNSDVPFFESPAQTVKAIGFLGQYWRTQSSINQPLAKLKDLTVFAKELDNFLQTSSVATIGEFQSKQLLARLGFPVTQEIQVSTLEKAVEACHSIGFPLALKGMHPDILHKTEAGIVKLNLTTVEDVSLAFNDIIAKMKLKGGKDRNGQVLIQEMVFDGIEFILGVKKDAVFGTVVVFGLGGIYAEVLRQFSIELAPLTLEQALNMVEQTPAIQIVQGARGKSPVDLKQIAQLLV